MAKKQKRRPQKTPRDTAITQSPPVPLWPAGLAVIILIVFGILVYSNTFHSPFVFDDINFITKNDPHVHMKTFSWLSLREAALQGQPHHRILPNVSFALNYWFGGENTWGFHLVNLIIHLMTGLFLFLLVSMTLSLPAAGLSPLPADKGGSVAPASIRILVPFFAALLWLVHPVQTNAVTYMCQRMASMAALFYMLSMLLYVKGRLFGLAKKHRSAAVFFAGCALAGICAVATKENTATLPVFILLYEWFFFQDLKDIRSFRAMPWVLVGIVVFAGVVVIYLGENPIQRILAGYARRNFTLPQRVLTEFRVVAYYLSLIGFPYPGRLILDHDYPLSDSLLSPATTFTSMGMIIALFALAIYTAKKQRLFSFCILWFLGTLVIESSVIGIEIIYEHRLYLPAMMLFLLITIQVFKTAKVRWAAVGLLTATALLLGLWAHQRNRIWQSDVSFWTDCAAKSPRKARPYQNLAYSYQMNGQFSDAIINYEKSIRIKPHPVAWFNLGLALAKEKSYFKATDAYVNALKTGYNTSRVQSSLGRALAHIGELQAALMHFKQAATMTPPDPSARHNIYETANFLKKCGNPIACVKRLIKIEPTNPALSYKLGVLYERQGALQQAAAAYETVLKKSGRSNGKLSLLALNRLGDVYEAGGQTEKALGVFRQGLSLAPDQPYFYYQIARVYAGRYDKEKAIGWLEKAAEHGFSDWRQVQTGKRWQWIKDTPYYQKLQKRF